MMLTGLELKEYITNITEEKQIQQVSVDLKLIKVEKVLHGGQILNDKTHLPQYEEMISFNNGWLLEPGFYSFTFNEGVKVPNNVGMQIIQRSSLLRSGTTITSGLYDPNFECDNIGGFAQVNTHIFIEKNSRVACLKGWYSKEVNEKYLYNGQWQKNNKI